MEFTEEELKFIQEKRPELIKKPEPTLNTAIVAFLKKYEVAVQPPKDTTRRDRIISGAVTGIAGTDVGGDAFLISGQKKQTQVQEWTQWKQWALDHKEFPKFQTDFFNEVIAFNLKIDKKLEDPEFNKEFEPLLIAEKQRVESDKKRIAFLRKFLVLLVTSPFWLGVPLGGFFAVMNYIRCGEIEFTTDCPINKIQK